MKTFLEHVAEDLLQKHGNDLSQLTLVFPNKRASLFLNAHLSRLSDRPIWSPRYITISELFRKQSRRIVADPIKLVCELYHSFTSMTGIDETLDHFYGWGQMLLSDFDDLDKSMADADRVLANLGDLHEMDNADYLTEEQMAVLQKFFSSFSPEHSSLLRERFLHLWSHMADIYHDFNNRLAQQGLAYEGALYREVVERLSSDRDNQKPDERERQSDAGSSPLADVSSLYVFVGFNVLQQVEQRLFTWLKREGRARFYWDFDDYYLKGEAGTFIIRNLSDFPNELDRKDETIYNCFAQPKKITIVSAPTENIQARFVAPWLNNISEITLDTAIVLCDENLLPTVIHCLPDNVSQVNITTGYPLSQAPVAALIATLFTLRTQGYQPGRGCYRLRQVNALLRHPYIVDLSPEVATLYNKLNGEKIYYPTPSQLCSEETTTLLFRDLDADSSNASLLQWMCDVIRAVARHSPVPQEQAKEVFSIQTESLFRAYTLLNRLQALVEAGDLRVDVITLQRLATQLMQTTTIPFHGEPAQGLQVMGLLETRCLDFKHVLLLSAGEGNIPKGVSDTSFIPYSLRKAYGMTTADQKVAIYSYYFHRLLQRSDDITIIYNNATSDGHTGEMSRFLLQLMVEDHYHHISTRTLQAAQSFIPFSPQPVEKTKKMIEMLISRFTANRNVKQVPLTPSAINRYMRCPLQFYYTYVNNLREPDDTDDDIIDNRIFGNIFHEAAQIIYTRLRNKSQQIVASDLEQLLKHRVDIERAVDQAIRKELFHLESDKGMVGDLSGLQIINREVIIHYLRQLLTIDLRLTPFTIEGLETDVTMKIGELVVGGRIDRLDRIMKDGHEQIRVIDYKTGSRVNTPLSGVDAIFQQEQLKNHSDYYLQTFLYSIIVSKQLTTPTAVSPALLFIQHAGANDYNPVLKFGKEYINDVAPYADQFMALLTQIIAEIFNPAIPFMPTQDRSRCDKCPYRLLCY